MVSYCDHPVSYCDHPVNYCDHPVSVICSASSDVNNLLWPHLPKAGLGHIVFCCDVTSVCAECYIEG